MITLNLFYTIFEKKEAFKLACIKKEQLSISQK